MIPLARRSSALARSLRTYHGDAARNARMDALYGRFLKAGNLAFDIGAHVGDRIASFRRLGARVVALEPQPGPARVIRLMHHRDADVKLVRAAAGDCDGEITLHINSANPTVSTASHDFVRAAGGAGGWEGQVWDETIPVLCVTLDRLIAEHGRPAFIKIDVEGFEAEALGGLSRPPPALSFEFTTIQKDVARACLARCRDLGYLRYNAALGESQALVHDQWQSADEIARWLAALPVEANSGDIYARLA